MSNSEHDLLVSLVDTFITADSTEYSKADLESLPSSYLKKMFEVDFDAVKMQHKIYADVTQYLNLCVKESKRFKNKYGIDYYFVRKGGSRNPYHFEDVYGMNRWGELPHAVSRLRLPALKIMDTLPGLYEKTSNPHLLLNIPNVALTLDTYVRPSSAYINHQFRNDNFYKEFTNHSGLGVTVLLHNYVMAAAGSVACYLDGKDEVHHSFSDYVNALKPYLQMAKLVNKTKK